MRKAYIVSVGTINIGFSFVGVFATYPEAVDYGEIKFGRTPYSVVPIEIMEEN